MSLWTASLMCAKMFFTALLFGALSARYVTGQSNSVPIGYAPTYGACPSNTTFLRPATGLSNEETTWVAGRKAVVAEALDGYLSRLHLKDFDVQAFKSALCNDASLIPTISLAISGGGAPATWNGMGVMQALDDRFPPAVEHKTGGLLQTLTYLSGLSGGSFPVTSYPVSDWPTTADIVVQYQPDVNPYSPTGDANQSAYNAFVFAQIAQKLEAGFPLSLADFLGRVESYTFVPGPASGINTTWSGVTELPSFKNHTMPLPLLELVVVAEDAPPFLVGDIPIRIPQWNSTLIEATPFEFGSWQGPRTGFTPTKYLGTSLVDGKPANSSLCVTGYDNAGFMIATASCAWNLWYEINATNGTGPNFAKRALGSVGARAAAHAAVKRSLSISATSEVNSLAKRKTIFFPESEFELLLNAFNSSFNATIPDVLTTHYVNPWLGINNDTTRYLSIVDGSESGQTIPLAGIMQPARKPDLIMALDVSQETTWGWQNGTNLIDTANWAKSFNVPFPKIASAVTMLNRNYTLQPTFFGCRNSSVPLVLYLNNAPYTAYTNFSIIDNQLELPMITDIFTNAFNTMTQGNGTLRQDWAECMGCAAIQRSIERLGWNTTVQCEKCFIEYCWDEVDDEQLLPGLQVFNPPLVLDPSLDFATWNQSHQYWYTNGTE